MQFRAVFLKRYCFCKCFHKQLRVRTLHAPMPHEPCAPLPPPSLSLSLREVAGAVPDPSDPWTARELLVKWKRYSYIHCSWDSRATLVQVGGAEAGKGREGGCLLHLLFSSFLCCWPLLLLHCCSQRVCRVTSVQ